MIRRLAATAFAIAVIVGALVVRQDRGTGTPSATPGDVDAYTVFDDVPVTLLCADELAAMCEALTLVVSDVVVEPAWETADRLAGGGELRADAWLTFRPWEELAKPTDPPSASVLGPASSIARSPVVLAGPTLVMAAVQERCPDPLTLLACATTGEQQVMARDPRRSALGALALAALDSELRAAPAAPPVDEEQIRGQLRSLLGRARQTPVPYEDVMRSGGNAVALTLEADVTAALDELEFEEQRDYDQALVLYPFETRTAEVVMVPATTFDRAGDLALALRSRTGAYLLGRSGFDIVGREPRFLSAEKVFASRPTIRTDLAPPPAARLAALRSLGTPGDAPAPTPAPTGSP